MSLIQVLDEATANKIAAGEVVDRPSSVIKELIENAIDAGSTKIEVEIMAGGTSFMRVTDNGRGMSREDAELSIQRHATSKLRKVSDLMSIQTLGFRGEALPTIAAVSKFSLITRQEAAELAVQLNVEGGRVLEITEAGAAPGTTIRVEDLFFNTPARKKFLKTPTSEGAHINDVVIKQAIANPQIAFKFINNNKLVVSTPGSDKLFDALKSIYGNKVSKEFLTVDFHDTGIDITGFVTKPNVLRSSRQWQTYIVNERIIGNRSIAKALDNAYQSMLPKSGYPLAVLKITVPPNTVDVNVHPQKSEMKFEDESRIFKAVYKSVLDAVKSTGELEDIAAAVKNLAAHAAPVSFAVPLRPKNVQTAMNLPAQPPVPTGSRFINSSSAGVQYSAKCDGERYNMPRVRETSPVFSTGASAEAKISFEEAQQQRREEIHLPPLRDNVFTESIAGEVPVKAKPAIAEQPYIEQPAVSNSTSEKVVYEGTLQPLGQVDLCYITATDGKGLYIVDQHAAHERILYDKFSAMTDAIPSQQLLVHIFMDFSEKECGLIKQNSELFQKLGFSMEQSGPAIVRLKEIPADIPYGEAEGIVREILEAVQEFKNPTAQEIRHACLAITACKAAIKAGDYLNLRQMQILLDELSNTAMPYTCPHGRPSIIRFDGDELAKMFKRT